MQEAKMKNHSENRNYRSIFAFISSLAFIFLILSAFNLTAQVKEQQQKPFTPPPLLEIPDDPYIPVAREGRETSPAYSISTTDFFATQVNVIDTNLNIIGDAANEPSIAVDPTNPDRMAIGWRQFDTINNNFRQAGYAYTTDGGLTWTFPGVIEPGIFRSDPVLDADSSGTFFYNSLTVSGSDYLCNVFRSIDTGSTWDMGIFAHGGDKQWMTIDKSGGTGNGNIYAFWTQNYSICYPGFFTRSANHGDSYEDCVTIPDEPFWGTLDVDAEGVLYVAGVLNNGFMVARSSNARDSSQVVSWDFSTPVSLDGTIGYSGGSNSPNPAGLLGQTWVAVDKSNGPNHGNVYLLCSVDRISISDPLDVMFSRSTDGGVTWSSPVRVNDDASTSAWQWFGTLSVAPNGRIDVIWLDTRDNPGTYLSSLYYSFSLDGGATWSPNERLSIAFDPHLGWPQQSKMGDYFDMVSDDEGARLAWAATFNGEQDVYYGRITPNIVTINNNGKNGEVPVDFTLFQNYPNPFNPETAISFSLSSESFVALTIFDIGGRAVATLAAGNLPAGTHKYIWNAGDLASGVYMYRLSTGTTSLTKKLVLMK